jgi:RNA polymerase sigma-70 factor, ECF subfamily
MGSSVPKAPHASTPCDAAQASLFAPSAQGQRVSCFAFSPQAPLLASDKELTEFLKSVEKRAFKRTAYAVRDDDAALDIVQDAMIRLAESYASRPPTEWPLVFQRILSNATMDWFRRQKVRNAVVHNMSDFEPAGEDGGDFDLLELLESQDGAMGAESAADTVGRQQILEIIDGEVANLPTRQREAFILRYWEELDVAETADAMGCSEGSVKTHCSRAVHSLAKALKAKGIQP